MEQANNNLLAGHPKAEFAGGRRKSQPQTGVLNKTTSDDEESESDSKDVIKQSEQDNKFFHKQIEQRQEQARFQDKYTNAERNFRALDPVTNNHIRQPGQFTKGVSKEFKAIAKEMKS
ncbi:hypothetical protein EV180_003165 [Coemansia sp. RSA 518]|nr:hypothetical protein GGH15_003211 [Coemansia sp. RSA 562]KAJ2181189.1 hypothetical protein GGF45_001647 [Coemansia sp. RSA 551]KAJ2187236.1 hypothetical protein EV181_002876 [Coemansia sp. RSA 532]KAJ2196323.1 hypothetical protein IW144_002994 [Coemansia sp. RSA 522]KAJ2206407.1 hypothetical protein IW145_002164 [Coemansia sp. RSA 521]KAJ2225925.1 hypothetical protein EV180_003165 [Coemansia sp. RSA 518]KAJ2241269.1 hypothetical protein GGH97_004349 [Coemansia sp. RSA 475]KAJ2257106.1 hyp